MKRTIKLAVVAALALGATSAFATNGATMIGYGAKSFGMGGTGIGVGHGAESALANPAMITTIKGKNEVSFGGTVFMPDIETTNDLTGVGGASGTGESKSDFFVIPSVSLASKVNDNFYWGIGMWGTGGLGVDFRNDSNEDMMKMVTALQTMQFGVPLAYTNSGFTVAATPIVQYSSLDINYQMPAAFGGTEVGSGVAQDVAVGYNLGLAYVTNGLTLGAVYKSKIKFDIQNVLDSAIGAMTNLGQAPAYSQDEMATPAEYGVGISYTTAGHTLAIDYKNIAWSDAEVYQDFGWEDQDVFAIGYEYKTDKWAARAGYQYAKGAVQDNSGKGLYLDTNNPGLTNTFNLLGFPGTQESHITLGGTYAFNETISLDVAAVFGLENKETFTNFGGADITNKHSEQGYSVQLNYAF
ncbi:MAG: aromatic hydrocarbon degradation protein [Sulfurimonas sp. RIFCSPLOWO2_12_FULL_36_74]|uniref:OmpP1/FadL family transporter n=1 Tax=Sulfurimonas sp. RIFCSPLOWO2_12_36_12 TaxID=1802253 RepID=UPI0008B94AA4|nr:outer membrane protein transport protein [Sulfurimonas sp. RIFCSPLOWO2_12_36_12]OHE00972.1 MAG: aromatic hydrocarbon degradation protein [Sulfurimonas sp. RIFCSPLOWO2_02_FULL_36_28]OHE01353.1 MAG: aromatic hydrocarbon degradation protein [Sulfurimonas sp. RIFCSPLOWO2_12_36_12]OHE08534.1 MAG: aromatic hydrocarbon degradation protein [Sulfurimonas sp. RIFCSPLOWO2_12_FULL_36_74]